MPVVGQARNLIACDRISWSVKLAYLRLFARRILGKPGNSMPLKLADGTVYLDPCKGPDLKIFYAIFIRGDYLTDYQDAFVGDLGAHKGYATAFAKNCGAKAVVSYEPNQGNFECALQSSDTYKNRDSVSVIRAAVAGADGITEMHTMDQSWSHSLIKRGDRQLQRTERIETVGLSGIIERLCQLRDAEQSPSSKIILLMDIEGAECEAITRTDLETLAKVDEMFVELHKFSLAETPPAIAQLKAAGFEVKNGHWQLPEDDHVELHLVRRPRGSEDPVAMKKNLNHE